MIAVLLGYLLLDVCGAPTFPGTGNERQYGRALGETQTTKINGGRAASADMIYDWCRNGCGTCRGQQARICNKERGRESIREGCVKVLQLIL